MKKVILLLFTCVIAAGSAFAQQGKSKEVKMDVTQISNMLHQMAAIKNSDAVKMIERATANGGQLSFSKEDMQIIGKWHLFIENNKVQFSKLFKQKVAAKDKGALRLASKMKSGQLAMGFPKMVALVKKWSKPAGSKKATEVKAKKAVKETKAKKEKEPEELDL